MFEQTFKNIDDILHKDAGCTSELDYTEQSSWLLFLKYLDALEADKSMEATLEGRSYSFILDQPYRWETWASPRGGDGKLDHHTALTGDDLRDFVDKKLFPYLAGFKQRATGPNTIEYKIGEIFGEIQNKVQSGYNLRDVINLVDQLRFRSQSEKHELSHLYEVKIKNMGNAGRNGGEYYTPRPLIRAMIKVLDPQIGERVYDGAAGSAGFLCEAFEYMSAKPGLSTDDLETLQKKTFFGKEKKSLAYVIGVMNMILHGIEAPNIVHTNTLGENINDIQEKDRFDVILANPPFGGKERKEVQQNFPIKTGETAFLFMQHFIKSLRAGGRAAIVIKNTFLSNTDNASVSIRKLLLESCNLHTKFKQIIGRGTRLYDGKDYFTIYDFVKAHHHFSDPEWDGEPAEPDPPLVKPPRPDLPTDLGDDGKEDQPPGERTRKIQIRLADGKARTIQHMTATSFWGADGKPMSTAQFLENLFGALPEFFKNEDELRILWSDPSTRKALLNGLAEKGFSRELLHEMQKIIEAENSDLFDVLAFVAFATDPETRTERASKAKTKIEATYSDKQRAFLEFVLDQYIKQGVDELDGEKLPPLLRLKYAAMTDAVGELGPPDQIRKAFLGFQQYLYY